MTTMINPSAFTPTDKQILQLQKVSLKLCVSEEDGEKYIKNASNACKSLNH